MKILLVSHVFFPAVGGIETMSRALAEEFTRQGHEVIVVTQTPHSSPDVFSYTVVRQPTARHLLRLVSRCDVCFHNNISLHAAWPLFLTRRPWVVAHQTWMTRSDGTYGWQDWTKRCAIRFARNIAISRAVAERLPVPATIIGNCYREDVFHQMSSLPRDLDLVFLGRLVSDKGMDILLDALTILKKNGLTPCLTVIGDGPERTSLQAQAQRLQIEELVCFAGSRQGEELVTMLNAHKIMVVPSRWPEPFGIVALEGLACGCIVVGSKGGGLPDAIGPCGITVPREDSDALASALQMLLTEPQQLDRFRAQAPTHLAQHAPQTVADAYLKIFHAVQASMSL